MAENSNKNRNKSESDRNDLLQLLKTIVDAHEDAFQISDIDGQMIYVNKEASNRLNIDQEEVSKYHVFDFEPLFKNKKQWLSHINDLRAIDYLTVYSSNINQATGQSFPVEVTVSIKEINGREYITALSKDISSEIEAKEQIKTEVGMQDLLMTISKSFINLPLTDISDGIKVALQKIGVFINVDRVYIFDYDFSKGVTFNTYEWCNENIEPQIDELQNVPLDMVPDWVNAHQSGNPILVDDVSNLPAGGLKDILEPQGIKSLLSIPLLQDDECIGFIGFDAVKTKHKFGKKEQDLLKLFAEMLVNIEGRKQADYEIQKLSQTLSTTSKTASVGGWELDIKTNHLTWTDMMYHIHGLDPQADIISPSLTISLYKKGEHRDKAVLYIDRVIKEGVSFDDEFIIVLKDGQEKWVRVIGRAEKESDNIIRIYGSCQDIDDFKTTQLDLEKTKSLVTSVFNEMQDVVWSLNYSDLSVRFLTPSASALYQIPFDELTTAFKPWKTCVHPEDQMSDDDFLSELNKTSNNFDFEIRLLISKDEIRWVRLKAKIVELDDNTRYRIDGSIVDITKLKNTQKESELARIEAEEANRAKSQFLANMSHEIRTPLNAVIGFTDLLVDTALNPEQHQFVKNANVSAHILLDVINDILDFSKIEAGKLELDPVPTDVRELIEQSIDIFETQAAKKNLELLLDMDIDLPGKITVDPVRLRQMIVNLLGNALKFTHKGEVGLHCDFNRLDNNRGLLHIVISDTGIGMNQDQIKMLGQTFKQMDSSTTRKYGGTGLGLAISSKLLEKMDSHIEVSSNPGKGSSFSFTLKVEYDDTVSNNMLKTINFIKKVLIIDDNENNREILRKMLSRWNISVMSAENGITGLQLLESNPDIDCMIIDYHMPYIDGVKTIELLREKPDVILNSIPVILLHSSAEDQIIMKARKRLEISEKLIKPVKLGDLEQALVKACAPRLEKPDEMSDSRAPIHVPKESVLFKDKRILIAEDVDVNMMLVKIILEKLGIDIITAKDGHSAIEQCKDYNPDLILMDIQMPELDGYEATRQIRSKGYTMPIIALTAGVVKGEKDRCIEAGMNDYLPKPLNQDDLINTVKKYFSQD